MADREGAPNFSIFGVGPDAAAVEHLMELGFDRIILLSFRRAGRSVADA